MAVDIRAKVTCSAGELISGSTSDSYRAESGIIYQRGSCVVKGVNALSVGTPVTFSYQGTQRGGQIKRRLLVLGSSCNPFEGTTNYELGCEFTLYKDYSENKVFTWRGVGDDSMDEEDATVVTVPLEADKIAAAILTKLGLSGSCNLTNKFSVAEFDLSGGYVNVLGELLQSECKLAYITPSGTVAVVPALGSGTGTSFGVDSLIELQPLNIGPPPTAKTIVNYSTRKLKKPDPDKADQLNWELQESYGLPTTITVDNPVEPFVGGTAVWDVPDSFQYTYTPYTLVKTKYDTYDRVVKRTTTERSIVAEVAPSYIQHIAGKYVVSQSFAGSLTYTQRTPPEGSVFVDTITTQSFVYRVKAPLVFDGVDYPEGYEEITREEIVVEEPLLRLTSSTPVYSYAGQVSVEYTYGSDATQRFVANRNIRTFETSKGAQGQQLSKTFTEEYMCHAYTQEGQQILADALQKISQRSPFDTAAADALFANAQVVKRLGTRVEINSGREVALQQRPPQGERTNADVELVNATADISADSGVGTSSFQLPYAPDDIFIKSGATYSAISSDAKEKAAEYGRVQLKLRSGARYGVNVKAAAYAYSGDVAGSVGVSAGGVSVFGVAEGVSYTMDSSGIVVSMDVLALGTSGGTAGGSSGSFATASWVPLPTGVTTLPAAPAVTDPTPTQWLGYVATVGANPQTTLNAAFPSAVNGDGVQDTSTWKVWKYNGSVWVDLGTDVVPTVTPSAVVPFTNERVAADAVTRTSVEVQSLPYALALQTALSLVTKTTMQAQKVTVVNVPLTTVSVTAPAPAVALGAAVKVPLSAVAVAALAPDVAVGASVQVPLSSIAVAALAPTQAGAHDTVINVPLSTIAVGALVPEGVGANLETFYNSWRLQVYGTDAWVFPDWWAD